MAKDAGTGETIAKRVVRTYKRESGHTLALTFSTGAVVVTTEEHPFYAGSGRLRLISPC